MKVQDVTPVKFVLGIIYPPVFDIAGYKKYLESVFGPAELQSREFDFDVTAYYEAEMGKYLLRTFIAFGGLISPGALAGMKRLTNVMEDRDRDKGKRSVNLDPGYLDLDKFVLASAKYGRQKIYIGKGIYADPALYYYKKTFHPYEWSFPDFHSPAYLPFFSAVRDRYKEQLRP